jgi:hypothetical protein
LRLFVPTQTIRSGKSLIFKRELPKRPGVMSE